MPAPNGLSEGAQVLIALISVIGTLGIAGFGFLGVRANQTRGHARAAEKDSALAREQVQNSHPINLRDELDTRHNQLVDILTSHTQAIEANSAMSKGIQRDVGRLADADQELTRQAREDRARLNQHIDAAITAAIRTKETP